jgi:hypothetical protein
MNFTTGVYPYPFTVADMALNTPLADLARPPANGTTAKVRDRLVLISLQLQPSSSFVHLESKWRVSANFAAMTNITSLLASGEKRRGGKHRLL